VFENVRLIDVDGNAVGEATRLAVRDGFIVEPDSIEPIGSSRPPAT
jgi:hypothetical protein